MPQEPVTIPSLRAGYEALSPQCPLDDRVLVAVAFGSKSPIPDDPRCLRIGLEPLPAKVVAEVWRGCGPVRTGTVGRVRYAEDGTHCAGYMTIEEGPSGGSLAAAAEVAYHDLLRFQAGSPYRHIWRMWNFITDINAGPGDDERYRQFCLGRARAFACDAPGTPAIGYPAASAVGKQSAPRTLDICWIAGRTPAVTVENPRQVSAFKYPRQHGPAAPSFSRATVTAGELLLISGTASIVGHVSMHVGDVDAQLHETLRNIDALLQQSTAQGLIGPTSLNNNSLVKVYVRNGPDAERVERELRRRLDASVQLLVLAADICRSDLLIEIEAAHQA